MVTMLTYVRLKDIIEAYEEVNKELFTFDENHTLYEKDPTIIVYTIDGDSIQNIHKKIPAVIDWKATEFGYSNSIMCASDFDVAKDIGLDLWIDNLYKFGSKRLKKDPELEPHLLHNNLWMMHDFWSRRKAILDVQYEVRTMSLNEDETCKTLELHFSAQIESDVRIH